VKPFLQFPGLAKPPKPAGKKAKKADSAEDEEEEGTAASKLDFALATGNNPTLFDNQAATELPRVFEPADLALMLITFQCFSPGGRIGVALWNGKETPGKGSSGHAPCSPSAMLHAFLRGKNVLETITANLVTEATVRQNYGKSFGHPVWEKFPASFQDQDAIENATTTFLGRLMPLARAILLKPDGAGLVLANGLDYPTPPEFKPEPSATLIPKSDGKGHVLLGASSARALWRELPALAVKRRSDGAGGPLVLSQYEDDRDVDLWIGALVTDKASILDAVESVFHIPARMFSDGGQAIYADEVKQAVRVSQALGDACKSYRQFLELKPQEYPEKRVAERRYWTEAEQRAPLLLEHLRLPEGSEEAAKVLTEWRKALWKAAFSALEASCPSETARQQRAYALALRELQKASNSKTTKESHPEPSLP
jgi:CRISPR system Cascade subunit CasA